MFGKAKKQTNASAKNYPAKQIVSNDYDLDGSLVLDVYQTPKEIVVSSTIAGVKPEDLNISFKNDTLTIQGSRKRNEEVKDSDYYYRECYFGEFSRSVVMPEKIDSELINASFKNGILTVRLPKLKR